MSIALYIYILYINKLFLGFHFIPLVYLMLDLCTTFQVIEGIFHLLFANFLKS